MKTFRSVRSLVAVTMFAGLAACGGDDGGGGGIDAAVSIDAPNGTVDAAIDAPPASTLMGLGQLCVGSMQGADCPPDANGCLTFGGPMGICTKACQQNVSFTTDGQGVPGTPTPDPTAQNAVCTAIYNGTVGAAACTVPVNFMPAPANNMLSPNTTYTALYVCGVTCGAGNTCPTGLTCNTQSMLCTP